MERNEYLISQARSNAGPQIHLVNNWIAAYVFACEDPFNDSELQGQAEALVQFVAGLDKTPTRTMLMTYADKVLNSQSVTI